jgi:hypothetical protein
MRDGAWVAEEPEVHLMPHIRRAVERHGSPWSLAGAAVDAAVLVVTLRWDTNGDIAALRTNALALVGSFAEANTFIRQERRDGATVFEVTTGMLDGDGPLSGHGHLVRFIIES